MVECEALGVRSHIRYDPKYYTRPSRNAPTSKKTSKYIVIRNAPLGPPLLPRDVRNRSLVDRPAGKVSPRHLWV